MLFSWLATYTVCLLYKYWKKDDEKHKENRFRQKLSKETVGILKFIAHIEKPFAPDGIPTKEFCIFSLSDQELKFHLEEMKAAACLKFNSESELVGISDKGRAFLHSKGMLPKYESQITNSCT